MKALAMIDAAPITVKHSGLKRFGDGGYKSVCPVCRQGVLLIYRDPETMRLMRKDRCSHCAQVVVYSDEVINGEAL